MSVIVVVEREVISVRPDAMAKRFLTRWLISPASSSSQRTPDPDMAPGDIVVMDTGLKEAKQGGRLGGFIDTRGSRSRTRRTRVERMTSVGGQLHELGLAVVELVEEEAAAVFLSKR